MQDNEEKRLVFLIVARPGLDNDYAFQETLADFFEVPITLIHEALIPAEIRPLVADEYCIDLSLLSQALEAYRDIDDHNLSWLSQQKHTRIIILLEDDRCHLEVLVAFALMVAAYGGRPEVMSIEGSAPNWQIVHHFQPGLYWPSSF